MSIAGIDITLQRVSDAATSINNTNKSLNDSLKEVKKRWILLINHGRVKRQLRSVGSLKRWNLLLKTTFKL